MEEPIVHVIAGPNGAGKSTFASRFLHEAQGGENFLNADIIAAGLAATITASVQIRAGRLLLERWKELAAARQSFAFETTLTGKTYARMLKALKEDGDFIRMAYLWLENPGVSLTRIRQRVEKGGHDIPVEAVQRRHMPGLKNFFELYLPLADEGLLFDASFDPPVLTARFSKEEALSYNAKLYEKIQRSWT